MNLRTDLRSGTYFVYIRTIGKSHFESELTEHTAISLNHDPNNLEHGPTYAEIRLNTRNMPPRHLQARNFQLHTPPTTDYSYGRSHMPPRNYVYLIMPHGRVYGSVLENYNPEHKPF